MTSLGLRVAVAIHRGHGLAARPAGHVHLVAAPEWTASGRFLTKSSRTVCGANRRRLSRLSPSGPCVDLGGRRFCRRCTSRLALSPGRDVQQLVSRDDWLAAYDDVTVAALRQALAWSYTVEETHVVGRLALMVLGPASYGRTGLTEAAADRKDLDDQIVARRRALTEAALTPEERAARAELEADAADDRARIADRARKDRAIARAMDRRNRGQYLMPHQRALLDSA